MDLVTLMNEEGFYQRTRELSNGQPSTTGAGGGAAFGTPQPVPLPTPGELDRDTAGAARRELPALLAPGALQPASVRPTHPFTSHSRLRRACHLQPPPFLHPPPPRLPPPGPTHTHTPAPPPLKHSHPSLPALGRPQA